MAALLHGCLLAPVKRGILYILLLATGAYTSADVISFLLPDGGRHSTISPRSFFRSSAVSSVCEQKAFRFCRAKSRAARPGQLLP